MLDRSWPTICCTQVVPVLPKVSITMSPARNLKPFQRVESTIAVRISRVFFGQRIFLAAAFLAGLAARPLLFLGMRPPAKAAR